jgi:hypothetical protein
MATLTDIFTGNVAIPGFDDPLIGAPVRRVAACSITVVQETGPNAGRSAGFLLSDDLQPGQTGMVDVIGVYGQHDGDISIQDPETPSELNILRHNDEALCRFLGNVKHKQAQRTQPKQPRRHVVRVLFGSVFWRFVLFNRERTPRQSASALQRILMTP